MINLENISELEISLRIQRVVFGDLVKSYPEVREEIKSKFKEIFQKKLPPSIDSKINVVSKKRLVKLYFGEEEKREDKIKYLDEITNFSGIYVVKDNRKIVIKNIPHGIGHLKYLVDNDFSRKSKKRKEEYFDKKKPLPLISEVCAMLAESFSPVKNRYSKRASEFHLQAYEISQKILACPLPFLEKWNLLVKCSNIDNYLKTIL